MTPKLLTTEIIELWLQILFNKRIIKMGMCESREEMKDG